MSTPKDEAEGSDAPVDIAQVRADIERDRARLAETVDALGQRMDVKARTRAKVGEVRADAADRVSAARTDAVRRVELVRDAATDDAGRPTAQTWAIAGAVVVAAAALVVLLARRRTG